MKLNMFIYPAIFVGLIFGGCTENGEKKIKASPSNLQPSQNIQNQFTQNIAENKLTDNNISEINTTLLPEQIIVKIIDFREYLPKEDIYKNYQNIETSPKDGYTSDHPYTYPSGILISASDNEITYTNESSIIKDNISSNSIDRSETNHATGETKYLYQINRSLKSGDIMFTTVSNENSIKSTIECSLDGKFQNLSPSQYTYSGDIISTKCIETKEYSLLDNNITKRYIENISLHQYYQKDIGEIVMTSNSIVTDLSCIDNLQTIDKNSCKTSIQIARYYLP